MSSLNLSPLSLDHRDGGQNADLVALDIDAIVVGVFSGNSEVADIDVKLGPGAHAVDSALGGKLLKTLRHLAATGAPGQVTKLPTLGA
ncbi:MAG: hypothetical protein ACRDTD_15270, partial [Pseudonocardiaceae bacterium]